MSTSGRISRARASSMLSRGPSSTSASQTRLKSSSTKRESNGASASKRWYAATLAKHRVSRPLTGRTPLSNRKHRACAPQTSLPWVSALIATCGPARPLSKLVTYAILVFPDRYAPMSHGPSSIAGVDNELTVDSPRSNGLSPGA